MRLWNAETGEQRAEYHVGGHENVRDFAFNADGTLLASCNSNGQIRLWSIETGENMVVLEAHTDWAVDLAFSPDGTTLASGSWDGTVRLWGIPTSL
jgi:WD40 repeat protein